MSEENERKLLELILKLDGKIAAHNALLLNAILVLSSKDTAIIDKLATCLYRARAKPGFGEENFPHHRAALDTLTHELRDLIGHS